MADTAPPKAPEAPQKGFSMFTKKPATAPTPTQQKSTHDLEDALMNATRRLRLLESRYDTTRKKLTFIESNMLEQNKKLIREVKAQNLQLLEMKKGFLELQSRMRMIVKELQLKANDDDVQVLKKYLSYWEPIKFVTREQVEEMLNRE